MRRLLAIMMALCILATACTSSETPSATPSAATNTPVVTATPPSAAAEDLLSAAGTPEPTPTPGLTIGLPDLDAAVDVDLAPLGTYAVAREGAGIRWTSSNGDRGELQIPVYVAPFTPPRTLVDTNWIDGISGLPVPLTNWADNEGVLVLRVIAGGPDDDWLKVQAPTRPHDRFIWVRRNDFDLRHTTQRVEIDLAHSGKLTVLDGDDVLLESEIVQGREARETPTHLTYIEHGIRAIGVSPAYGTAILSMASYSEVLGTFGGGLPSNFLHGTNQPELMGQRVSSGEIRVPNEFLDRVIETIVPGTPVLLFDSSGARSGRDSILARQPSIASTIGFGQNSGRAPNAVSQITPQLWRRCDPRFAESGLLCRMEYGQARGFTQAFLVAKPDAGVPVDEMGGRRYVPVYDTPGGDPRMLLHEQPNELPGVLRLPLRNPGLTDQPLVLWPLEETPDRQWIRVQAPSRPQRRSVWVRASDFDIETTDMRIEIDIAGEGKITLFDGETEVISNAIVSGRESRPTTLGESYIDKVIDGPTLSPAYGPYVASYPIYSDVLSTFGSGGLPNQAIHGTNQPELMGQQVSSGKIRVPNEVMAFMAELPQSLVGARVLVFDSTGVGREAAISELQDALWSPARTAAVDDTGYPLGVPLFG